MSYQFVANGVYMQGSTTSQYDSEGATIAMWVKRTAAQWALTSQGYGVIFGADTTTDFDNSIRIGCNVGAADTAYATARDTADNSANEAHPDTTYDDTWVVVCGTFTSNTRRDVYVEDYANTGTATTSRTVGAALDTIRVGASVNGFTQFEGLIGPIGIWNKVLSEAEINSLQSAAETGPRFDTIGAANLIAYYLMDTDNATETNLGTDATGDLTHTSRDYQADHPTITSGIVPQIMHNRLQQGNN